MKKATVFLLLVSINLISLKLASAQSKNEILIRNATVMTAAKGTLENTDILIQNGKIARIGKNLKAASNAQTIDASGKFVTPGIVDCHSHTMMDAVNEFSYSVTSMTRIRDVLNPTDIAIYRALAGGVTAANLLHGSANAIGGQNSTVKFKYGKPGRRFRYCGRAAGNQIRPRRKPQKNEFQSRARTNAALSRAPVWACWK
jgi:imidazolonepropionase-like amidohydrolase